MKNIPVSLRRRKLLPAIPVLLYFINLQYVYRNIFIKNKFLQSAVLFFSKYILRSRSEALLFIFCISSLRNLSVSADDSDTLLKKQKREPFEKTKQLSKFLLAMKHYKEDLLKMVMTLPLISSFLTGPKSRLSFAPERMSDIIKYSPSFSLMGYFTASVS